MLCVPASIQGESTVRFCKEGSLETTLARRELVVVLGVKLPVAVCSSFPGGSELSLPPEGQRPCSHISLHLSHFFGAARWILWCPRESPGQDDGAIGTQSCHCWSRDTKVQRVGQVKQNPGRLLAP